MKLTIKAVEHIAECSSSWDGFLPGNHHLQSRHLSAFENSNIDDITPHYVRVLLKDKLIGLVYLQEFRFQHKHLNFNSDQQLLSRLIKLALPGRLPILICGHLFRINFQGFYFKDPAHKPLVFDAVRLFNRQAGACNPAGIIIKDCEEVFVEEICKLGGYRFFNGDVTMELSRRSHWNSFTNYLEDLNKNYRQRARKIIKSFEAVEKREFTAEDILNHSEEINTLYWNVVNKQTIKLGTVNIQYFYQLKLDLKECFQFYALYHQNVMIGFYTFIFYPSDMETHFIGLDYEANKTFQTYFNILFLGAQKMIERKLNKLELGRTAREAKANTGALPRQIFNYINIRNPIAKITLNHFLKSFNKRESKNVISRTPLKITK